MPPSNLTTIKSVLESDHGPRTLPNYAEDYLLLELLESCPTFHREESPSPLHIDELVELAGLIGIEGDRFNRAFDRLREEGSIMFVPRPNTEIAPIAFAQSLHETNKPPPSHYVGARPRPTRKTVIRLASVVSSLQGCGIKMDSRLSDYIRYGGRE